MLVLLPAMLFAGQKNKTKKANAETAAWRYEIQNEAVGADNTVLVRVWSYSKSYIISVALLSKAAEIVKILTNLARGYVHFFTKFL